MATLKHEKMKEDAHRKALEDGILEIKEALAAIMELLGEEAPKSQAEIAKVKAAKAPKPKLKGG